MKPWLAILPLSMLAALPGGCAALRKADAPATMRLAPDFGQAAMATEASGSVSVAPVQARGFAATARYTYVDAAAPGEVRQAATLFWEEPPANVVERALVAGLKTRFAIVRGTEVGLPADHRVIAILTRFEEVGAGGDAQATVAFDATMVSSGKAGSSASFCATAPVGGASPTLRARAFEAAIVTAVGRFVQAAATASPTGSLTGSPC